MTYVSFEMVEIKTNLHQEYIEGPRRKGQYSGRSQYRSFEAKMSILVCMCVLFRTVSEIRVISLYSSKTVGKKEILLVHTVGAEIA
jgi:hypothetical protein